VGAEAPSTAGGSTAETGLAGDVSLGSGADEVVLVDVSRSIVLGNGLP
jgi:hypothetical protein